MKGYKIVNTQDGNIEIDLESVEEIDALYEALEELGWYLLSYDLE